MISTAFGLIYSGEHSPRMRELTLSRAVAAVPFGGRYRTIDFILSNLVNSGVSSVGLITQKNYHSLMDHLGAGKEWDLQRKREGLFMLPPFMTKENTGMYRGSVDALRSCMGYVRRCPQQYVVLSGSHTIFNRTLDDMIEAHIRTGADITLLYNEEPHADPEELSDELRLTLDGDGRVTELEIDPHHPHTPLVGCDLYVMDKHLLEYLVDEAYSRGEYDFLRDILLRKRSSLRMMGFRYDGYVARLSSLNAFYRHNMALLEPAVRADLFNPAHPIYTKVKDEVSARYGAAASVHQAMLADGCFIRGTVENSILFRGVTVEEGATVRNSILMQGVRVGKNSLLDHVIIDKGASIGEGRTLMGYDGFPILLKKNMAV